MLTGDFGKLVIQDYELILLSSWVG